MNPSKLLPQLHLTNMRKAAVLPLAAALILMIGSSAWASTISLTGHLNDPADSRLIGPDPWTPLPPPPLITADPYDSSNNVMVHMFDLLDVAQVHFKTFSFGLGGIDPYFSLFSGADNTATFLASNYDQAFSTGGDIDMTANLAAGSYTVALSAFANMSFAENYGSGTLGDGFTAVGYSVGTGDPLYYNLEISTETQPPPPIPEPATLLLTVSGLLGLAAVKRWKMI